MRLPVNMQVKGKEGDAVRLALGVGHMLHRELDIPLLVLDSAQLLLLPSGECTAITGHF